MKEENNNNNGSDFLQVISLIGTVALGLYSMYILFG
tara:strand:+ start:529 stop:636 length:108 start_codon:yes stop_codon:yes gene_type:complete